MQNPVRALLLDTEVFFHDRHFRKPLFAQLRAYLSKSDDTQFLVSQVVIAEVINQYREEVKRSVESLTKAQEQVQKIFGEDAQVDLLSREVVEDKIAEFSQQFNRTLRNDFSAEILPLPDIAHSKILKRAIDRRKPFDAKGKGYQDTMIWLSLVQAIQKFHFRHVAFVSNNSKDFCDGDGKLAQDLQDDLKEFDVDLQCFQNLDEALKKFFPHNLLSTPELLDETSLYTKIIEDHLPSIEAEANDDLCSSISSIRYNLNSLSSKFGILEAESLELSNDEATIQLSVRFWRSKVTQWSWTEDIDIFKEYFADVDCSVSVLIACKSKAVKTLETFTENIKLLGDPISVRRELIT